MNTPSDGAVRRLRPRRRVWIGVAIFASAAVIVVATILFFAMRDSGSSGLTGLVERVAASGDPDADIVAVDLDAARAALDLPDDAGLEITDPADEAERQTRSQFSSALRPLRHLGVPTATTAAEAIDVTQITALASAIGRLDDSIVLVQTDQDLEEIVATFEAEGYVRSDDTLTRSGGEPEGTYSQIAWNDGILALTMDPDPDAAFLADALTGSVGASERADIVASLLDDVPAASLRTVPDGCVSYLAVGEQFTGESTLVLGARDDAATITPTFTESASFADAFALDAPAVDGDVVRVEATANNPHANMLASFVELRDHWTCG